jgi:hypothetical protein
MGPLSDSGLTARLAQYRYEIRKEDSKGEETWTSHEFTICLVELAESMALFRGICLRELFDPKTIVWLTDHPMRPHIELRNGFLVVYVPGWIEDLGRVVWLLEAAEKIAERVQAEIGEAAPTVG